MICLVKTPWCLYNGFCCGFELKKYYDVCIMILILVWKKYYDICIMFYLRIGFLFGILKSKSNYCFLFGIYNVLFFFFFFFFESVYWLGYVNKHFLTLISFSHFPYFQANKRNISKGISIVTNTLFHQRNKS